MLDHPSGMAPPNPAPSLTPPTPPAWPHCGQGASPQDPVGCRGIHVPEHTACLAHLADADRDAYLSGLTHGADIDHRGTPFTEPLLYALLDALLDSATGQPRLGVAELDSAIFQGGAWFESATFQGDAWFNHAIFQGDAWFDRRSFRALARSSGRPSSVPPGSGRRLSRGVPGSRWRSSRALPCSSRRPSSVTPCSGR